MNVQDRERFVKLETDVEHIKADVAETKQHVANVDKNMVKISNKLFNDESTGDEGIISLTRKNGLRLTKLENIKVAIITVLFALGSAFGWIANNLLK